jgi:hypothetical protein
MNLKNEIFEMKKHYQQQWFEKRKNIITSSRQTSLEFESTLQESLLIYCEEHVFA